MKGFSRSERMELDKEYNKAESYRADTTNSAWDFFEATDEIKEMGHNEFNIIKSLLQVP